MAVINMKCLVISLIGRCADGQKVYTYRLAVGRNKQKVAIGSLLVGGLLLVHHFTSPPVRQFGTVDQLIHIRHTVVVVVTDCRKRFLANWSIRLPMLHCRQNQTAIIRNLALSS